MILFNMLNVIGGGYFESVTFFGLGAILQAAAGQEQLSSLTRAELRNAVSHLPDAQTLKENLKDFNNIIRRSIYQWNSADFRDDKEALAYLIQLIVDRFGSDAFDKSMWHTLENCLYSSLGEVLGYGTSSAACLNLIAFNKPLDIIKALEKSQIAIPDRNKIIARILIWNGSNLPEEYRVENSGDTHTWIAPNGQRVTFQGDIYRQSQNIKRLVKQIEDKYLPEDTLDKVIRQIFGTKYASLDALFQAYPREAAALPLTPVKYTGNRIISLNGGMQIDTTQPLGQQVRTLATQPIGGRDKIGSRYLKAAIRAVDKILRENLELNEEEVKAILICAAAALRIESEGRNAFSAPNNYKDEQGNDSTVTFSLKENPNVGYVLSSRTLWGYSTSEQYPNEILPMSRLLEAFRIIDQQRLQPVLVAPEGGHSFGRQVATAY